MKPMKRKVYNYCFSKLTPEEEKCATLCESIIVYDEDYNSKKLDRYKKNLGKRKVRSIYNRISDFINTNCTIVRSQNNNKEVHNLMWKTIPLEYENSETGELTTNHKQAVSWFNKGADIRLYTDGNYRVSWVH